MQIQMNKKIFSKSLIIPVCEIICSVIFVLSFIYLGMNSSFFQQLFKFFYSENSLDTSVAFGSEFFILAAIFSGLIIILAWINRFQWLNFFNPSLYLSERRIILILLSFALCVSIIPLFISWSTANSYDNTIGGILPYSDANAYYSGAELFLDTGKLDGVNQRRPINAILFSERLLFSNFDFRIALLLQSIMFGFAAFFAALAVARTLGKIAGIMMFAGLFAFAAPYIPIVLNEVLGITLGALGFTLLWIGINEKKQSLFFFGLIILTLALFARAGAMFVLPALIIFSGYIFRGDKPYNFKIAAIAAICIVSGFFINQSLIGLYGDGTGSALSNFSLVLYGLADGGKGWAHAYIDFPQLGLMTEAQQSSFLYDKSLSLITSNPLEFIKTLGSKLIYDSILFIYLTIGLVRLTDCLQLLEIQISLPNVLEIANGQIQQFLGASSLNIMIVILPIVCIFFIGCIRFFVYQKNKDVVIFLFTVIAAIFFSLPFFFSEGGYRSTAATFPFIAVIISIIITGLLPKSYLQEKKALLKISQLDISIYPLLMGIFIISSVLIFPIIGPNIAKNILNPPSHSSETHTGMDNQSEFIMRIDHGIPYLHFESNQEKRPIFSPNVHTEDFNFFNNSRIGAYDPYFNSPVKQNSSLAIGYDIVRHRAFFIQIPDGHIMQERQYLKIIAQPYRNSSFVYVVKNESDLQHLE